MLFVFYYVLERMRSECLFGLESRIVLSLLSLLAVVEGGTSNCEKFGKKNSFGDITRMG